MTVSLWGNSNNDALATTLNCCLMATSMVTSDSVIMWQQHIFFQQHWLSDLAETTIQTMLLPQQQH